MGGNAANDFQYTIRTTVPIAKSGSTAHVICPDLLRLEQLGEADGWRGRLVRAFFWLIGPR